MTGRAAEGLALAAFFALLAIFTSRPIWDIDVFWHIAAGRAILDGGFPTTDVFGAIDPDRTWVTFQWGYEVLVHALDRWGGLELVKSVHALVMLLGFALFYAGCRRRLGMAALPSLLATALLLVLFEDRINVRPHVFNLLFEALLLPILLQGPGALDRRRAVLVAATVLVWANLHAGGAFLFLVLYGTLPAGALLSRTFDRDDPDGRAFLRAALAWTAAAVPALLSPNFVRGNVQAFTMLEGTEAVIGEWYPSWHFLRIAAVSGHYVAALFPSLLVVVWVLVLVPGGGWRRPWIPLLGLGLLVLAHRSVRFVYLAAFAALLLVPLLPGTLSPLRWPPRVRTAAAAAIAAALYASAWEFNVAVQHGDLGTAVARAFSGPPTDERRFPIDEARFLEESGFEGRVFCQANWGGYLLWRLWPRVTVTADGRGNYPKEVAAELAFVYDRRNHAGPETGEAVRAIYERHGVDAVVHQHPVWPEGYTPPPSEWLRVLSTPKGAVWVRATERGRAYVESLRARARATPAPPTPRPRAP